MSYYGNMVGPDPIREAFKSLCNGASPPKFVRGYRLKLTDDQYFELVEWVLANAAMYWTVGSAMIEVAQTLVDEAVSNGNIPPAKHWTDEVRAEYRRTLAKRRIMAQRRKGKPPGKPKRETKPLRASKSLDEQIRKVTALFENG